MSSNVIPLPGLAIHLWPSTDGGFGVETVRGLVDPDFPPMGAASFANHALAIDEALSRQDRTGLPIISHVEGF